MNITDYSDDNKIKQIISYSKNIRVNMTRARAHWDRMVSDPMSGQKWPRIWSAFFRLDK